MELNLLEGSVVLWLGLTPRIKIKLNPACNGVDPSSQSGIVGRSKTQIKPICVRQHEIYQHDQITENWPGSIKEYQ